jgi:hypothetical protein
MQPLKAHVENGQVILDEPTDLPDGTPLNVTVSNDVETIDSMDPQERAEFLSALDEAIADEEAGRMVDGIVFAQQLLAKS